MHDASECCKHLTISTREGQKVEIHVSLGQTPPTAPQGAPPLRVSDILTRISTDLSDVFFDISEVTSHKAAVIRAVERGTPTVCRLRAGRLERGHNVGFEKKNML